MSWPIRILLIGAVAFTIVALCLPGCGGGSEPLGSDNPHAVTTIPVNCSASAPCK